MKRKMNKIKIAVIAVAAVLVLSVGGTFAYLRATTNTATNAFEHGVINITIQEDFTETPITADGVTKKVMIKNDSLNQTLSVAPCYTRVALVASWVNEDGSIAAVNAEDLIEYQFSKESSNLGEWVLGADGYYYFTGLLEADQTTSYLIESVKLKANAAVPESGHLEINVLADAVQKAEVNNAWNSPVKNGGNTSIYAASEE